MKQLDKLLLKSFWGPFLITFAIALFVLLMQILWVYLDDIAGKGLSFWLIMELLAYKCVGLVPLALPLALLISSVMVLGGLGEHYELASFKSAGVSLFRIMRPLIFIGIISAAASYVCSDYVIPAANLQFGSRMYDIQQKKPTLNMEPGVFNEDFNQFAIRLGEREENGRDIRDVLIYDHSKANINELSQIVADSGQMFSIREGAFFVMRLFDGHQYVEQRPGGRSGKAAPFLRTNFESYTKLFDLGEFRLERHAASLFATNRSMLSTWQLQEAVDSIDLDIAIRKQGISNHLLAYLPGLPRDSTVFRTPRGSGRGPGLVNQLFTDYDSLGVVSSELERPDTATVAEAEPVDLVNNLARALERNDRERRRYTAALQHPLVSSINPAWPGLNPMLDSVPEADRQRVYNRARSGIRSIIAQAQSGQRLLPGVMESRVKHIYDMHMKFSMAVVCVIFIFIGAPMGAIVRKGGFGVPILVSIIFFVLFIILTIFCRKLAESFVVGGAFAGWLPCIVLFPVSLWITRSAMNDVKLVDPDRMRQAYRKARDSKRVAALRQYLARRRSATGSAS